MKSKIILLPGLGYSLDIWTGVIAKLPKNKFSIHPINLPEYGSFESGHFLYFDEMARNLKKVIVQNKIKPPYSIAGHSLGGYISLIYTGYFPQDVDKLIITSTPLRKPDSPFPFFWKILTNLGASSKIFDDFVTNLVNNKPIIAKKLGFNLINLDPNFLKHCSVKSVSLCCRDLGNYDWAAVVDKIDKNILIAYGDNDPAITKICGTELYTSFKHKRIVTFRSNHSIPTLYPKELAEQIVNFLS